jgi:single-stranded-DNA-specific exonuclease
MSVLGKKWIIKNKNSEKDTFEKILENRGLLNTKRETALHDPFLFRDMEKTVARINKAIKNKERIIIFGDYDVDGITGTAILVHALNKLGATVSYRLPHRVEDGYGLSEKFIHEFIEKNIKLLITVDCGISCKNEIKLAAENNIDTIITDHHTIPETGSPSQAFAIIHPKEKDSSYPFPDLTGAGVALKLAEALLSDSSEKEQIIISLLELACLGTVADLGPLKGENWLIVKKGLKNLMKTKWTGLKKIMKLAEIKQNTEINSSTIGYRIAPRINAAGRIGNPYLALTLLLQENENEKVHVLGNKLEELNSKRKLITHEALQEAEKALTQNKKLPFILIAQNPDWHVGILGLIAGRLSEKYMRPAIIMQDFGDVLVGSARSPEFFNIIEAISEHKDLLISFGGHEQAAGFNIKKPNLKAFNRSMAASAKAKLKDKNLIPTLKIDCPINKEEISFEFLKELETLKPFGVENTPPTFLLKGIEPCFIEQVGKEKNHLKFSSQIQDKRINVIAFQMGEFAHNLRRHRKIDLVFQLERNIWNNKESLQLHALDFREAKD